MKESEIRPADIFEEYLRLSAEDARTYFVDVERESIPCPACASEKYLAEFSKHGFDYVSCAECRTLYQSPRPPLNCFERFYSRSASSRYWAEKFFPTVAEARRDRIFKPRVESLTTLCESKSVVPRTVMDIGAGYGIFLEEWGKQSDTSRLIAVEPSKHLAEVCRSKGMEVVEAIAEKVTGYDNAAELVVCFEVLEHVYDPLAFVQTLARFVTPGGYLLVSTLGVDGFDIQTLWERSNSVSPPHHINFLSIDGFKQLFRRAGLTEIDVSTPGKLDVDIVKNAYDKDPSVLDGQRFARRVICDDELGASFQKWLVEAKLSSHTWVFAKKPGGPNPGSPIGGMF